MSLGKLRRHLSQSGKWLSGSLILVSLALVFLLDWGDVPSVEAVPPQASDEAKHQGQAPRSAAAPRWSEEGGPRLPAGLVGPIQESADLNEASAIGFVLYDGTPVADASVTIRSADGEITTTTQPGPLSPNPYFTATLSGPPLNASPGDLLKVEVSYASEQNVTTVTVQEGEQELYGWLSSTCGPTEISSGLVVEDTIWTPECGPYIVSENLLVVSSATLTVMPGTTVEFDVDRALWVDGALDAAGQPSAMIAFSPHISLTIDHWGYILCTNDTVPSRISWGLVEYAGGADVPNNAAIRVDGASASLDYIALHHSASNGIQVFNNGAVTMYGLTVADNAGWGIAVDSEFDALEIQNCMVLDNGEGGIRVEGGDIGVGSIANNEIAYNHGSGIEVRGMQHVDIVDNYIVANQAYDGGGVHFWESAGIIQGNIIGANEARGSGGGIKCYRSSLEIVRNLILTNKAMGSTYAGGGIRIDNYNVLVEHNVIASNLTIYDDGSGGGPGAGICFSASVNSSVRHNALLYNYAKAAGGAALYSRDPGITIEDNTIISNTATGAGGAVQLTVNTPLNFNNLYGNSAYDLYYGAPQDQDDLDAQSNWWGTTDPAEIMAQVYDWFDDPTLGLVDYDPWLADPWTAAPVSPPTGLEATSDDSAITLSWAPNPEADVAGYKMYYAPSELVSVQAAIGNIEGIDVGNVTSTTLSCLPPGTYYLSVTAYDNDADGQDDWTDGNESWFPPEVNASTFLPANCPPPDAPTGLSATAMSQSQIVLNWQDNASDETSYHIERSPDGSTGWTEIDTVGAYLTTFRNTGLDCETSYYYRVRAYRAGDGQYSAYSNVDGDTTAACPLLHRVYLPIVLRQWTSTTAGALNR